MFGLLNRHALGSAPTPVSASWAMLEVPGMDNATSACVRELFSNSTLGVHVGGVTLDVAPHDLAMLRVVPGAATC